MLIGATAQKTRMFGRINNFGEQVLIITLHVEPHGNADAVLFMPVPVKPGGRCGFFDVEYDDLFADLDKCWEPSFVISQSAQAQAAMDEGTLFPATAPASNGTFFQTRSDLGRLDPKLRPPPAAVAPYADYGFAMFRLPKSESKVKPLALVFESREAKKLFFPTLTLVDGNVPDKARFEHRCYLQVWTGARPEGWLESDVPANEHVDLQRAKSLVRGELRVHRTELRGERKNEDLWARLA